MHASQGTSDRQDHERIWTRTRYEWSKESAATCHHHYIKIFVICVCAGRSPEVAGPRIKNCSYLGTLSVGGYGKNAVVHASQGTNDGQDHERIQLAAQERDMSGHLFFTESRWRDNLIHGERIAWVTAQGPRTVFSSVLITNIFATNYKQVNEFFHWLIKWPCALAGSIDLRHCNLCPGQ